jgi:2-polyprenyl-6-hydroxyphenyl methylase/3-demethylubiquinone-9 3-methyltransferase
MHETTRDLYRGRRLAEAYPGLAERFAQTLTATISRQPDEAAMIEMRLRYLDRLVDVGGRRSVLVLGCGPRPQAIRILLSHGYDAVGVEPVAAFARSAREFLGDQGRVLEGAAEGIPLPDASMDLIFCDSVLEHVTSPSQSLAETFRVLRPGGVCFITTSNRYQLSLLGKNEEYTVRFFHWLPTLVQESYVFRHLHYEPRLANFTTSPAVHWFTYAELCARGREAGFSRFYSLLDLMERDDPPMRRSRLRRWLLPRVKRHPWLRAAALTQYGNTIIMLKAPPESA